MQNDITKPKSYQSDYWKIGLLLGFGAPIGSLLIRCILPGHVSWQAIRGEMAAHAFYYQYMTIITPLVFGVFGYRLGSLLDELNVCRQPARAPKTAAEGEIKIIEDALTGLYNQKHILELLDKEIERANRSGQVLSCLMIDIDRFREVNEQYGFPFGDNILKEVVYLLQTNIRKIDILGRYGGDKFLAILPDTPFDAVRIVAQKIQNSIAKRRFNRPNVTLNLTLSIGCGSFCSVETLNRNMIIQKLDQALLKAKSAGDNQTASVS